MNIYTNSCIHKRWLLEVDTQNHGFKKAYSISTFCFAVYHIRMEWEKKWI